MDPEKVCIYIDGSNFYGYLKSPEISFPKGIGFNFKEFVSFLVADRICESKRYYTGVFRNFDKTSKSDALIKGQQKFFSKLERDGFIIKKGKILCDKGGAREKGTDVKIATDLIVGAVDNQYDTAIVISSDTDLVPALKYVKFKKKKIEYIGFSHNPSFGMQKSADFSRLLLKSDIEKFKIN